MKYHEKDGDCTLDANAECIDCGAWHGDPCPLCGGSAYHKPACALVSPGPGGRTHADTLRFLSEAQNRAETASQQWTLAQAWASRHGRRTEALSASQRVSGYTEAADRLSTYARHLQSAL